MSPDIAKRESAIDQATIEVPRDSRGRIKWKVLARDGALLERFVLQQIRAVMADGTSVV